MKFKGFLGRRLAVKLDAQTFYYVAVGADGRRRVVWGMGETEREARKDAAEWSSAIQRVDLYQITADQYERVKSGEIVWTKNKWEVRT